MTELFSQMTVSDEDAGGAFEATGTVDLSKAFTNTTIEDVNADEEKESAAAAAAEETEEEKPKREVDVSNIEFKNVWRMANANAQKGARKLWHNETDGAMTKEMCDHRVDLLCFVAYDGDEVIAVSTVDIQPNQGLGCRIAYFRCIVHSDYHRKGVGSRLAVEVKKVVGEYSRENPEEKINCMGMQVFKGMLGKRGAKPFWPELNMILVGYSNDGLQARIAYFDHVEVDL